MMKKLLVFASTFPRWKHKIYKAKGYIKYSNLRIVSMIPGDSQELPDDYLQNALKLRSPITNIQVPGMTLRSNAGIPSRYFWRPKKKANNKIYKQIIHLNCRMFPGDREVAGCSYLSDFNDDCNGLCCGGFPR